MFCYQSFKKTIIETIIKLGKMDVMIKKQNEIHIMTTIIKKLCM